MTGQPLGAPPPDPIVKLGRLTDSVARTLVANLQYALTWDTEAEDTDAMIDLTATANLTGTVATNGTTTLTGTGTSFTTELLVGHEITVNGQTRRVTGIGNNTSLSVESAFSGSASGLPAVRLLNDRITAKTAGVFIPQLTVLWPSNASGYRELIAYTGSGSSGATGTLIDAEDRPVPGAFALWTNVAFRPVRLAVNDFVRFDVWQNAGAMTLIANTRKASLLRVGA